MDKLRLDMKAVDEIEPELRELSETMNKMSLLTEDFEGKEKVNSWWVHFLSYFCKRHIVIDYFTNTYMHIV